MRASISVMSCRRGAIPGSWGTHLENSLARFVPREIKLSYSNVDELR
jgi:hypothetical protein